VLLPQEENPSMVMMIFFIAATAQLTILPLAEYNLRNPFKISETCLPVGRSAIIFAL